MPETREQGLQRRTIAINRLRETFEIGQKLAVNPTLQACFLARAERVDSVYDEFQTYHNRIISLTDDGEFADQDKVRAEGDRLYYLIKGLQAELIHQRDLNSSDASNNGGSQRRANVRLPKISLPCFDGSFKAWPSFFDLFNSLVHGSESLSDVEKFQYLLVSLKGEPLSLVNSLPLTDANYEVAYKALQTRYQNKRYLATGYYQEICNISPLSKPSAKDLRSILDIFAENVSALKVLNFPVDSWDFLLFNMLLGKLDSKTRTEFELAHSQIEMPSLSQLTTFLDNHCRAFETVLLTEASAFKQGSSNIAQTSRKPLRNYTSSFVIETLPKEHTTKCNMCSELHNLYRCPVFRAKPLGERKSLVKQHRLCYNCLSGSHFVQRCNSKTSCKFCSSRHHSLLHEDSTATKVDVANAMEGENSNHPTSSLSVMTNALSPNQTTVLLSTAIVDIQDSAGNFQKARVLLDSGSMANFISEECCRRLGLKRNRANISVEGLNSMSSLLTKGVANCTIKPHNQSGPMMDFSALIVTKVCSHQPQAPVALTNLSYIKHLQLADEHFHKPSAIDILIGAELVPYIMLSNRVVGEAGQPIAMKSILGWVLQGKVSCLPKNSSPLHIGHISIEPSIDFYLEKFWEIEKINSVVPLAPEDIECETLYRETVTRDISGRFMVSLPFKHKKPYLGTTYNQALRRLLLLERRLAKNSLLRIQYSEFMQDYLDVGHMSIVPPKEHQMLTAYYIPHHCVLKPDNVTTKLRVVFDASAKGSSGLSLNDTLYPGPKLQRDIFNVLLTFRTFPIVFMCDIKQMYRQILIAPEHRDYQRILWRFSPENPVEEYRLNTVTFGVSSSPYLALRTLQELATCESTRFPLASKVLREHTYVDDIVTGAPTVETALALQAEVITLLRKGGFELRKWASNCPELLSAVSSTDTQMPMDFDKQDPIFIKVLGLQWNPYTDSFSYASLPLNSAITKRSVLSEIARIYDPLGFLTPCVLFAKYLMQQLWIAQIGWDDEPAEKHRTLWIQFRKELPTLSRVSVPRRLLTERVTRLELHVFCDASQIGYGAVAYFKVRDNSGEVKVSLACGKSRVAPLKTVSIPRLELCAAVLAVDVVASIKEVYKSTLTFDAVYAWSDSQVVLTWISSSAHRWKTFVANRVSHIQDILPANHWGYVPSEDNPADCASRGITPSQLCDHRLWWNGPFWLGMAEEKWPKFSHLDSSLDVSREEMKTVLHVAQSESIIDNLLSRFSFLIKIQNIIAYMFRFVKPNLPYKTSPVVTPAETEQSLMLLVRHVQHQVFSDVLICLQKNQPLSKPIRKLAPFLDEVGVLRVGGRLKYSAVALDVKHPILLPSTHRFTELLIEHTHKTNLHPGFKSLHYLLLQRFWVLSPRRAIYHCLSKCLRCFRVNPTSTTPVMANLPAVRVTQVKPFSAVCIDYAGPFNVKVSKIRGAKCTKAYICVFVCCAVKAIHLELASDLSSESFLAAFRRFIARRGRCSHIYSDQGTNFKGAHRQLLECARATAQRLSISWHFNPPAAPHFNGLAEAGVKSVKIHIARVVGEQTLTYEEFYTLLTQIEALLNSRPLSACSSDPNDLLALTPSHFLTLEPSQNGIPEPDLSHIPINRLNRWQLIQNMHAHFWKRWHQEYLHSLQQRSKWCTSVSNIKLNTLVLIKNELKPPLQWDMARIIKLHPGADGVVRVVTVKTANGLYQRPIVKVCPLPVEPLN